jgi:hypothetical protein
MDVYKIKVPWHHQTPTHSQPLILAVTYGVVVAVVDSTINIRKYGVVVAVVESTINIRKDATKMACACYLYNKPTTTHFRLTLT